MKKAIFLDIETTGFSRDWDCIIELAAICVNLETGKTIDEFHSYLKPNKKIPAKITELTGIDDFMVANAPDEKEVLLNFGVWVADAECKTLIFHLFQNVVKNTIFHLTFVMVLMSKSIPLLWRDSLRKKVI